MPDAEFHIYGQGPALPELIELARDTGVQDSVKFMESVGVARIAAIMASASVGVVPKRADGFGNEAFSTKTFEFMACGVPLIVARTRIDQYYFNDRLVNFFEPGNWSDLAGVLLRVYQQPGEQVERVRAAEVFARRNSWEVRSADYRSLIDVLVARRAAAYAAPASGTELRGHSR